MNPQPRDYESPALTVELQALQRLTAFFCLSVACSPSFWLQDSHLARQLQTLESSFHRLGCRMDVLPRNHDTAKSRDRHDCGGIHSRFTESSKHCMTQGVEDKIACEDRTTGRAEFLQPPKRVTLDSIGHLKYLATGTSARGSCSDPPSVRLALLPVAPPLNGSEQLNFRT